MMWSIDKLFKRPEKYLDCSDPKIRALLRETNKETGGCFSVGTEPKGKMPHITFSDRAEDGGE